VGGPFHDGWLSLLPVRCFGFRYRRGWRHRHIRRLVRCRDHPAI
jgi:hypothetical protein